MLLKCLMEAERGRKTGGPVAKKNTGGACNICILKWRDGHGACQA